MNYYLVSTMRNSEIEKQKIYNIKFYKIILIESCTLLFKFKLIYLIFKIFFIS